MSKFVGKNENPDIPVWMAKNSKYNLNTLSPELRTYFNELPTHLQEKVVITSYNTGKHADKSRHYKNAALDLRYDETLFNHFAYDQSRPGRNIVLLDPNHGTGKHIHISHGVGSENKHDVLYKPTKTTSPDFEYGNEDEIEGVMTPRVPISENAFMQDYIRTLEKQNEEYNKLQEKQAQEPKKSILKQKTEAALALLSDLNLEQVTAQRVNFFKDGGPVTSNKKAVVYHSNDKDFEMEAKRALPLLEKKYGVGNVKIVPIEYGNALDLKKKVAENPNSDHYPLDHSGSNMFGIPTVHKYQKNASKLAVKGLLSPAELETYEKLLTEDSDIMDKKRKEFNEKFNPRLVAEQKDNAEFTREYKEALHDWSSNKSTDFLRNLDANSDKKRFENFTTTWSDVFPEDDNSCVYWGTCHFDKNSQDFTSESGIPSYSTIDDKWKGVNSKGTANSDEEFLNNFYYKVPFRYNNPLTKPIEIKSKEIKSFYNK